MANPVLMPKQGITVESCILTEWKVKVGDQVKVGDVIEIAFNSGRIKFKVLDIKEEAYEKKSFLSKLFGK